MYYTALLLAVLVSLTSSIQVIQETKSPVNRTLEQSCPPGMFLFGSLQHNLLDVIGAPVGNWFDKLSPKEQANKMRVTRCTKLLINCALRTVWIGILYCCPTVSKEEMFMNVEGNLNAEHLELIVEQEVFYLQGCLDHDQNLATRGRLAVFREPYRKADAQQCQTMFEFSAQRKLEYQAMRSVALVVLLGSIGICCVFLVMKDCIHYGLESRPRIIVIKVDWLK